MAAYLQTDGSPTSVVLSAKILAPTVTTNSPVAGITSTTAIGGGNVTSDRGRAQ